MSNNRMKTPSPGGQGFLRDWSISPVVTMDYDDPARYESQEEINEHVRREEERVERHVRNKRTITGFAREGSCRLIDSDDE